MDKETVAENPQAAEPKSANTPPYVSFTTLRNFLRGLGEKGIPGRVDKSIMPSISGGVQNQINTSLKYLSLVDSLGIPTPMFNLLATADEAGEKKAWREIIDLSYSFLIKAVNLKTATTGQVAAEFAKLGASGDTTGKCISFFLAACKYADIPVSAHIRPSRSKTGAAKKRVTARPANSIQNDIDSGGIRPEMKDPAGSKPDMTTLLMDKFPTFDPSWPDNLKTSWFSAYEQLMKRSK